MLTGPEISRAIAAHERIAAALESLASARLQESAIIERFGSLSSSAIRRILDAGATTIEERAADGVTE